MTRILSLALLVTAAVLLFAGPASACPGCKQALSADGGNMVSGFFWSILFMMSMPFVLLGSFGSAAYLMVRRERRRQAEASVAAPAPVGEQPLTAPGPISSGTISAGRPGYAGGELAGA